MSLLADQQGSYIPSTDAGVRDWLNNFAALISADPAAYGLTAPDAATLTTLADAYDAAYLIATNPSTRTTPAVNAKDAARNQAIETFRVFAAQIKANLGVTDEQKLALGLHINDTTPTPIPPPSTFPSLTITSSSNGIHVLRYADSGNPGSSAKPAGVANLQLFRNLGAAPGVDVDTALFVNAYTRQNIQIAYPPEEAGLFATYIARWANAKGEPGPWGPAVSMTVAFGGPIQQAA